MLAKVEQHIDSVRIQERLRTMTVWYIDIEKVFVCMIVEMMRETDVTWFDIPYSNRTPRASGMLFRTASFLQRVTKPGATTMNAAVTDSNA